MTTERAGTPGAAWERELLRLAEVVVPEDNGSPFGWDEPGPGEARPNRAARRAAKRRGGPRVPKPAPKPSSANSSTESSPS